MQKANFAFLFSGGLKKKSNPLVNFPLLTKSVTWGTVCSVTYSVKTPDEPQGEDSLPGVREDPDLGQVTQRDDDSCCEVSRQQLV